MVSLPTATADGVTSVDLTFSEPGEATVNTTSLLEGRDATILRQQIDRYGDKDGVVSTVEADAYVEQYRNLLGDEAFRTSSEIVGATYAVDETYPSSRLEGLEIHHLEGPVNSTEPVSMVIRLSYSWDAASSDRHQLLVQADGPGETEPVAFVTFKVSAPPGYEFTDSANFPENTDLSMSSQTVTATLALQGDRDFTLAFERKSDEDASAPGVWAAVLSLAGIGLLLRRQGVR